jgi:NitT/TauT family transport system permease protein/sulfonate transport system permease protein
MSGKNIETFRGGAIVSSGARYGISRLVQYSPLLAIAAIWEISGVFGVLPTYIPPLSTATIELIQQFQEGTMVQHTTTSLQRVYVGFVGGATLGIIIGIVAGRSSVVANLFGPVVSSTYPIPKIAIYPLLLVWLGIGFWSTTAVIFLAAFYPVYISTYDGARSVDKLYVWSAQNFNASRLEIMRKVVLPESLPQILSGLRVSLAISFIVLFAAELISSRAGLGHIVMMANRGNNYALMFVGILVIALLGFFHDRILNSARKRLLYWDSDSEGI